MSNHFCVVKNFTTITPKSNDVQRVATTDSILMNISVKHLSKQKSDVNVMIRSRKFHITGPRTLSLIGRSGNVGRSENYADFEAERSPSPLAMENGVTVPNVALQRAGAGAAFFSVYAERWLRPKQSLFTRSQCVRLRDRRNQR